MLDETAKSPEYHCLPFFPSSNVLLTVRLKPCRNFSGSFDAWMSPVWVHLVLAAAEALYDLNCAASLQVSLHGRLVSKRHFGHKLSGALIVKINSDQSLGALSLSCSVFVSLPRSLSLPPCLWFSYISSFFFFSFVFCPVPFWHYPSPCLCFSPHITTFPSIYYHCLPSPCALCIWCQRILFLLLSAVSATVNFFPSTPFFHVIYSCYNWINPDLLFILPFVPGCRQHKAELQISCKEQVSRKNNINTSEKIFNLTAYNLVLFIFSRVLYFVCISLCPCFDKFIIVFSPTQCCLLFVHFNTDRFRFVCSFLPKLNSSIPASPGVFLPSGLVFGKSRDESCLACHCGC